MYATTEAQFTASGTADILVDRYIPYWGCPVTLLSDNGLRCISKPFLALHDGFGTNTIVTSSYHPCTHIDVERVNHTIALVLAMVGDEQQTDMNTQLPHIERAYNNYVSASTGLGF